MKLVLFRALSNRLLSLICAAISNTKVISTRNRLKKSLLESILLLNPFKMNSSRFNPNFRSFAYNIIKKQTELREGLIVIKNT